MSQMEQKLRSGISVSCHLPDGGSLMKKPINLIVLSVFAMTAAASAVAQQPAKVGTLTCDVSASV